MNRALWLAAGIAGMLPVSLYPNAQGQIAIPNGSGSNSTVTSTHLNFVDHPVQGFSIAAGNPDEFFCLNNLNENQEQPKSAVEDKKDRTQPKSEERQRKKKRPDNYRQKEIPFIRIFSHHIGKA